MNCALAIQVLPKTVETKETVRIVDEVIKYIDSTGLSYVVGPFETTIEGDFERIIDIIKFCQLKAIEAGASSVMSYMKLQYSPHEEILSTDEKISKYNK